MLTLTQKLLYTHRSLSDIVLRLEALADTKRERGSFKYVRNRYKIFRFLNENQDFKNSEEARIHNMMPAKIVTMLKRNAYLTLKLLSLQ